MNKKILALGLVSCFAVMELSSCGGREAPIHIPEVTVNTYKELQDYVAANKNKPIELTFWHPFGNAAETSLTAQVNAFNTEYKDLIHVNLEKKGGYKELKRATTLEITNGNTPDIVIGYPDHFAEYLSGGIMVPLEKYIDSTDPLIGIHNATDVKDDFFQNYMDENQQLVDGHTFGLPFNKSTELAYYNKTLYTEFDIPTPEEEPYTWQNLEAKGTEIKNKLKAANVFGTIYECKRPENKGKKLNFKNVKEDEFVPFTNDSAANLFITLVRDFGGIYTERGATVRKGKIKFDSPEVVEAINMMKNLSEKKIFWTCEQHEEQHGNSVVGSLHACYTLGSSGGALYNKNDNFDSGVALIPYYNDGTTTRKFVIQQGTNLAVLGNNTDIERTAAWLCVRYLTSYHKVTGEGDTKKVTDPNASFAKAASYLPVRNSGRTEGVYSDYLDTYVHKDDTLKEDYDDLSAGDKILLDTAYFAVSYDNTWSKFTDPAFVGSSKCRDVADTILPAILGGNQTAKQGIKNAYDSLKKFR